MTIRREYDVVVLGGGGAGLSAAIAAAQRGANVALLEKTPELGGNTARSVASIIGAGTRLQEAAGIQDSPARFVADVDQVTGGDFNRAGLTHLAAVSAGLVHWLLDDIGADLRLTQDYKHIGHSVNRLHNPPTREGAELIAMLTRAAGDLPVTIYLRCPAIGVERTADRRWAVASGSGDTFVAGKVVLAADGFGASEEMRKEYTREFADLKYIGAPGNAGDGIRIGQDLGGVADSMTAVLGYAIMGMPEQGGSSFDTMVSWTVIEDGGFIVTQAGTRFGNEGLGYSAFVDAVIGQGGGPIVYAVFDQRISDSVSRYEQRQRLLTQRPGSPIRRLDRTAPFGIDDQALRATLSSYNGYASGSEPDPFGRGDFGFAPLQGEIYVAKAEASILTTLGGLRVNGDAQLLDGDGVPIPDVYAAGGTAQTISGLTGASGYLSGCGLLAALGYGMLAGRHATPQAAS
jgi:fumarate reductase flavoprotein subunit